MWTWRRSDTRVRRTVSWLCTLGALLLATSAGIHAHLYQSGYDAIPTIGPLFLFQAVSGFTLAAALLIARRVALAALGAIFALATVGGFLLSVNVGLFGFRDTWAAPQAALAFALELTAAGALLVAVVVAGRAHRTPALEPSSGAASFPDRPVVPTDTLR